MALAIIHGEPEKNYINEMFKVEIVTFKCVSCLFGRNGNIERVTKNKTTWF